MTMPLNLGAQQGLRLQPRLQDVAAAMQQQQPAPMPDAAPRTDFRTQAIAAALQGDQPQMQSGSVLEALGIGGEAFINARNERRQLEQQQAEERMRQKREDARRMAMVEALRGAQGAGSPQAAFEALIAGLTNEAPEQALSLYAGNLREQMEPQDPVQPQIRMSPDGTFYSGNEIDPATNMPRLYGRDPNHTGRRAPRQGPGAMNDGWEYYD